MQANFKNKQIACVEYDDLSPEQEREIFQVRSSFNIIISPKASFFRSIWTQRVQLGVTLAPAGQLPLFDIKVGELI